MASNTNTKLPNFDSTKILSNPAYKDMIDNINNNPNKLDVYKQLTILKETSNPLSLSNGGIEVINDMINKINVTPEDLNKAFALPELDKITQDNIDKNPEEYYKNLYNEYTYGDKGDKLKLRGLLGYTKNILINKGTSPDEVINKNPFISGLNFIANIVSVPPNLLAKGTAALWGKSDQVKIWGGAGWEDAFKAIDETPDIKDILTKTKKNIPLTQDENKKLKDFNDSHAGIGLVFNIVADPTLLAGAIGKGIGAVAKGSEEGFKIAKGFQLFSEPFKTIKDIKALSNLEKSGELKDILQTSLKSAKDSLGSYDNAGKYISNILNKSRINTIDDLLKIGKKSNKQFEIQKALDTLDDTAKIAKAFNKTDIYNQITKSSDLIKDNIIKMKAIQNSKLLSGIAKKHETFSNIVKTGAEKLGIRRMFQSDVPLEAKKVIDNTRRITSGLENNYNILNAKLAKQTNLLRKDIMRNEGIKSYLLKNDKGLKTVDDLISELHEKPKFAVEFAKKYNVNIDTINNINKAFDDHIITEAKYVGKKAVPNLASDIDRKEYSKLAEKYKLLSKDNVYHPDISIVENKMRDLLKNKISNTPINDDSMNMITDNVNYLTHVMTPEAKKIYLDLDSKSMGKFGNYFRSYIFNHSYRQRVFKGSIADIEKYVKGEEGKITPFAEDILKNVDKNDSKALKEAQNFSNKMNEFGAMLRNNNIRFFDNNVDKLLAIRAARSTRTIQQAVFFDGIKQFGSDKLLKNLKGEYYIKPKIDIAGLKGKYFDPDIAHAIEKFYNYTSDDRGIKKLFNFVRQFQTFWKSTTLAFPSTVLRNMFGNILNSFLIIDNPAKYIESFKDAVLAMKGQTYKVITKSGKYININDILKEAEKRGLFGTTLLNTDVVKELSSTEGIGGKIAQGLHKSSQTIENIIPISKLNNMAENYSKLALYIDRVKIGKSFDDAADDVYKVLFDYGDLNSTDRAIKKVIPFWTWMRRNLPLQLSNLLSTPSKTILKVENSFNQNRPGDDLIDQRYMSDWLGDTVKIRFGKDKFDKQQYILLEGLVPYFDIAGLIKVGKGIGQNGVMGGLTSIIDDTISAMSPLIKTPIELATNRSFAFHKDIQKSKYETTNYLGFEMSPRLKSVLDDWRLLNTLNKGIDVSKLINKKSASSVPEKDMIKMLFTWSLMNPISYDVGFSKSVQTRDYENKLNEEINNFKGYMNKLKLSIINGNKLNKGNAEYIRGRMKNILLYINDGFANGNIDNKKRGQYAMKLVKAINQ